MIYICTYQIGTNQNKKERRVIHDSLESAQALQRVVGGVIQAYEPVESLEHKESMKDVIVDEVSCLIDDMTNHSPYSPWRDPGSARWDSEKVKTLNNIRSLLDEI